MEEFYKLSDEEYEKFIIQRYKLDVSKGIVNENVVNVDKKILRRFEKEIEHIKTVNAKNINFKGINFNLDSYLYINSYFCSYNVFRLFGKKIQIVGEGHSPDLFSDEDKQHLFDEIGKLIEIPSIYYYEANLATTKMGKIFYDFMISKGVYTKEEDRRVKEHIHKAFKGFDIKNYKNFKPIIFKDEWEKINFDESIISRAVYDLGMIERILLTNKKNIFIYCGELHAIALKKYIKQIIYGRFDKEIIEFFVNKKIVPEIPDLGEQIFELLYQIPLDLVKQIIIVGAPFNIDKISNMFVDALKFMNDDKFSSEIYEIKNENDIIPKEYLFYRII
jgi:hypothetical protein